MSAWLCTDRHFAFLAKAAEVHGLTDDAGALAVDLKFENLRSLKYRYPNYPEDWAEFGTGDTAAIKVSAEISDIASHIEDAPWVAKAIRCLQYQSCEHPEWDDSHAAAIAGQLLTIVQPDPNAPTSPDAPWGID